MEPAGALQEAETPQKAAGTSGGDEEPAQTPQGGDVGSPQETGSEGTT